MRCSQENTEFKYPSKKILQSQHSRVQPEENGVLPGEPGSYLLSSLTISLEISYLSLVVIFRKYTPFPNVIRSRI